MPATAPAPAASPPPPERCPNCGAPVPDRFCGACGQERRSLRIPFHHLAGEAIGEVLSLDSKIGRTLARLFLRPGLATRTYLDGERASQTSPVKLYLVASFLFFLVSALAPGEAPAVRAGPEVSGGASVRLSEESLEEVRRSGPLGGRLAERLEAAGQEPDGALERRISRGFGENAPNAMFFLVPVLAVLLRLFHPRAGVFLAEHAVFSLHAHAVAFAFLLPGAAVDHAAVRAAGTAAAGLHFLLALRRVYGQGWAATAAKAAAIALLYLIALGLTLLALLLLVLLF